MDGSTAKLHEKWRVRADAAFERMFEGKSQEELVTFTEREDMAILLAKELAAFLLEEHLARDPLVRPDAAAPPGCPKCGQPGQRRVKKSEALPDRTVITRSGEVQLKREQWCCGKCRILFFSARRLSGTGDGRIQSATAAEGGAAGEQDVVQGRQRRSARAGRGEHQPNAPATAERADR